MKNYKSSILVVCFCSLLFYSACNNKASNNVPSGQQKKGESHNVSSEIDSVPKFSEEEVTKVYKDVKFGDNRKLYKQKLPKESNMIGEYIFDFRPSFDHEGNLFTLEIMGVEPSDNSDGSMKFLIDMITSRYGKPSSIASMPWDIIENNGKIDTIVNPFDVKASSWNIGDKRIVIFGRPLPVSQDEKIRILTQKLSWKVNPVMIISHSGMLENYKLYEESMSKKIIENTASEF